MYISTYMWVSQPLFFTIMKGKHIVSRAKTRRSIENPTNKFDQINLMFCKTCFTNTIYNN